MIPAGFSASCYKPMMQSYNGFSAPYYYPQMTQQVGISPSTARAPYRSAASRINGSSLHDLTNPAPSITALLDLRQLAPGLAATDRYCQYSTVESYIDHLDRKRPKVCSEVAAIATLTGDECKAQYNSASISLKGQDASTTEPVIFAIIISILSRPDAPKKQLIQSIIQDFLLCPASNRDDFRNASLHGQLLNLPSPMGAACDLINLPGYIDLNPVTNPHEFHIAWDDLIVGIIDVLKYEAFTKNNIGLLETSLQRFYPNSATIANHPFLQQPNESVSQWTARIANEERAVRTACYNANCPERCPTPMTMVGVLYTCAHPSLWPTAARLKQEQNIQINSFRDAMYLLMNAEHQVNYQDPQITIANQIRAHIPARPMQIASSVSPCPVQPPSMSTPVCMPTPTLPRAISPMNVPPSPVPEPLSKEIDQHPEMEAFRKMFSC
jgi:hypothetical protein